MYIVKNNEPKNINEIPKESAAYWVVTSINQGPDMNGRKELGIYYGNITDIAFAIAGKNDYMLQFERIYIPVITSKYQYGLPNRNEVDVKLMGLHQHKLEYSELRKLFEANLMETGDKGTEKEVDKVELSYVLDCDTVRFKLIETDKKKKLRMSALNKLTPEEIEALGL